MHADAVEFCSLQGPHALQLLASGAQDSQSVLRAWQAACAVANEDVPAALEAWLDFLHSYKCGLPIPVLLLPSTLCSPSPPSRLCRAAGMALDQLLSILSRPVQNKALQWLLLATRAFTSAWQAGDVSMRFWRVEDVSKLGGLSAYAVHLFLQQEAEVCKVALKYVVSLKCFPITLCSRQWMMQAFSSGAADLPEPAPAGGMDVDCDAVPDTPERGIGSPSVLRLRISSFHYSFPDPLMCSASFR